MNRELFQTALDGYYSLSEGLTNGDEGAIKTTRQMLRKFGTTEQSTIHENLLRAVQAAFRKWADGPLDDLLTGLTVCRCLAEEFLAMEDSNED